MPTISTLNSIAIANVSSYSTRAKASISTINGITVPSWAPTPTYWYISWGFTWAPVVTTDRITFATSITAAFTTWNITTAKLWLWWATSDTTTYWYTAIWGTNGAWTLYSTVDRITFSTGACAANTASNLSSARYWVSWLSDAATYGYNWWGNTNSRVATVDRITFSTSISAANTASNISTARFGLCSLSDWATYWYWAWWDTGASPRSSVVDRIVFSTSVTSANTASMSSGRNWPHWLSDNSTYWYISWWYTWASTRVDTTDRITFSTSAIAANTASNLSVKRYWGGYCWDWSTYWYVSWWDTGARVATTDRMTFSTWVFAANTASNLSQARDNWPTGLSDYTV